MDRNVNISPKMSHGVLDCDCYVTELHAYDFAIKYFYVIKRGVICARPCMVFSNGTLQKTLIDSSLHSFSKNAVRQGFPSECL